MNLGPPWLLNNSRFHSVGCRLRPFVWPLQEEKEVDFFLPKGQSSLRFPLQTISSFYFHQVSCLGGGDGPQGTSSYSSLESRLSDLGEEMRRAAGEAAALEAR